MKGFTPKVFIVGHTYYPDEPRIRRETKALVEAGYEVAVLCLRRDGEAAREVVDDVTIRRLSIKRRRGSPIRYALEYGAFFLLAIANTIVAHLHRRVRIIQVWNQPDVLVLVGVLPRLFGARVILDYRDAMPDTFVSKYGLGTWRLRIAHYILRLLESMAFRLSDHILTVHEPYRERVVARGVQRERTSVFLNFPDPDLFNPERYRARAAQADRFVLMYHGTVAPRFGIDVAIRAVARLRAEHPNVLLVVYGEGDGLAALRRDVERLGLARHVSFMGFQPLSEIPRLILAADVGVVPMRRGALEDQCLSTRLLEYLVMGRPVIASRRPILERYLDQNCVLYYEAEDDAALAEHIRTLLREPARRAALGAAGRRFMEEFHWPDLCREYVEAVGRLANHSAQGAST